MSENNINENVDIKDKKTAKTSVKTKKQSKIGKWIKELKAEGKKVVWPSKSQVINNTVVVLTTVFIAVLIIAGFDLIFKNINDALINFG